MAAAQLENLVRIGQLRREAPVADELAGLKRSAQSRLADGVRRDSHTESHRTMHHLICRMTLTSASVLLYCREQIRPLGGSR